MNRAVVIGILVLFLITGIVSAEFPELIMSRHGIDITPYLITPPDYYETGEYAYDDLEQFPRVTDRILVVSAIEESGSLFLVGYTTEIGSTITFSGKGGQIGSTPTGQNGLFLYRIKDQQNWVRATVKDLSQTVFIENAPGSIPTPDITLSPIETPSEEVRTYITLGTSDRWPDIGTYAIFSGRLGVYGSRQTIPYAIVRYEISEDGGATYESFDSVTTDDQGRYEFHLYTHESGRVLIRAVFPGDADYQGSISPATIILAS